MPSHHKTQLIGKLCVLSFQLHFLSLFAAVSRDRQNNHTVQVFDVVCTLIVTFLTFHKTLFFLILSTQ